jgi:hypothetical protein
MSEVPRALEVVAHDDKDLLPLGRKKIGPREAQDRQADYVRQVASGQLPLDQDAADVIREYLDAHHARQ